MAEDFNFSAIRSICPSNSEEADRVFTKKKKVKSKSRVDVLVERYKNRLDLWTGFPLTSEDLIVKDNSECEAEKEEEKVIKIFTWGD